MNKFRISWRTIRASISKIRFFGGAVMSNVLLYELLSIWVSPVFNDSKFGIIKEFLSNRYRDILNTKYSLHNHPVTATKYIWVFWWQGIDNIPPICRACYQSLLNNRNDVEVICISRHNYKTYIDIPDGIIRKVERGTFSFTHLSDIIRVMLLAKHGGLWVDATMYFVNPIPDNWFSKGFFSIKNAPSDNKFISKYRWSTFILGGNCSSTYYEKLAALMIAYAEREECFIEYMTIDVFMDILFEEKEYGNLLSEIPISNTGLHALRPLLNEAFDEGLLNQLVKDNVCFKLTYKMKFESRINGSSSFYKYIVGQLV